MHRWAKSRWIVRTLAVPLLLSLALHGLFVLALWFWPMRKGAPTLTIPSTRITLDTRVLEPRSSTLLPALELPSDLRGPEVHTSLEEGRGARDEGRGAATVRERSCQPPEEGRGARDKGRGAASCPSSLVPRPSSLAPLSSSGGSLFPLPATAASVVYVLDRSVSMGVDRKLDFARRELIASLRRLPLSVRFQVIDYNDYAEALILDGRTGLLPAEPAIVDRAVAFLNTLDAGGISNHIAALRRALNLHAEVIYFLTDADDLTPEDVTALTRQNHDCIIHTIELTRRAARPEGPLAQLARDNRGTYRRVSLGG